MKLKTPYLYNDSFFRYGIDYILVIFSFYITKRELISRYNYIVDIGLFILINRFDSKKTLQLFFDEFIESIF